MRTITKKIFLFSNIIFALFALSLAQCLFIFSSQIRKSFVARIIYVFAKISVLILGIKVKIRGQKERLRERGVFFVCNHLSYIDGIIAASLSPLVFIAKADLRNWPFFGLFTLLSNTIFVNRINSSNIQKEINRIAAFLTHNINVILFPEGTSTNGEVLLPFKSSFFAAPLKTKSPIVPLVIKYKKINGKALDDENKEAVYWYGTKEFLPHLSEALKLRSITVEITVCQSPDISKAESNIASLQRKHISSTCRKAIEDCLIPG